MTSDTLVWLRMAGFFEGISTPEDISPVPDPIMLRDSNTLQNPAFDLASQIS